MGLHVFNAAVVDGAALFRLLQSSVIFLLDNAALLPQAVDSKQLLDVVDVF